MYNWAQEGLNKVLNATQQVWLAQQVQKALSGCGPVKSGYMEILVSNYLCNAYGVSKGMEIMYAYRKACPYFTWYLEHNFGLVRTGEYNPTFHFAD